LRLEGDRLGGLRHNRITFPTGKAHRASVTKGCAASVAEFCFSKEQVHRPVRFGPSNDAPALVVATRGGLVGRLGGQLRVSPGAVLGWDMGGALALAQALGVNTLIAAELLPEIEAVMVRKLNEELAANGGASITP
jgi:hypothetical protein